MVEKKNQNLQKFLYKGNQQIVLNVIFFFLLNLIFHTQLIHINNQLNPFSDHLLNQYIYLNYFFLI